MIPQKKLKINNYGVCFCWFLKFNFLKNFAAGQGIEPRYQLPKSCVLPLDDAFHPKFSKDTFEENLKKLEEAVSNNYDAVIIEGAFCFKEFRESMVNFLKSRFPSVDFEWICFEKDVEKANKNLHNDDRKHRDPSGHEKINEKLMKNYTYPDNCKIIPIFQKLNDRNEANLPN